MLEALKLPTQEEFEASLDEAKVWASAVGYEESDVDRLIKEVRQRNHTREPQ